MNDLTPQATDEYMQLQRRIEREREARWEAERRFEEKRLEADEINKELQDSTEALWENASRLAAIMNNVPTPIITLDEDGFVEHCNRAAEAQFDRTETKFMGLHFSALFADEAFGEGEKPLSSGTSLEPEAAREAVGVRDDGATFPMEFSISSMPLGEKKFSVMIVKDITRQKRAAQKREELELNLAQAQKMEALGTLSGGIAHEINTPIQYVGDNVRFLQDAFACLEKVVSKYGVLAKNAATQDSFLAEIAAIKEVEEEADIEFLHEEIPRAVSQSLEGIERISEIVQAIKQFSHPDQQEKSLVDINALLENTITVGRNQWKFVAEVTANFGESIPQIMALPGELSQVFLNLLANAVHAIKDAKREALGTIAITTRCDGTWVEIRVEDSGIGIPKENLDKIFEPFFTTKEPGRGTGQGMSIVHTIIVKKHDGTLSIESEVGKGTTLIVRLPVKDEIDPEGALK